MVVVCFKSACIIHMAIRETGSCLKYAPTPLSSLKILSGNARAASKCQFCIKIFSRHLGDLPYEFNDWKSCRNYVVQNVLDQKVSWVLAAIFDQLKGHFGHLSMQKHSSNVVERCLKLAKEEDRVEIIRELINSPQFLHILQDAYGNYVIQSALKQCKVNLHNSVRLIFVATPNVSILNLFYCTQGPINAALVEAIKPHVLMLRSHPFGKKVLSSASLKK